MSDLFARGIVARCLSLRLTHPRAPARDALDLIMRGHDASRLDFGADAVPPSSFALVVAEAFDRGMCAEDWKGLLGLHADPALRAALLQIWRDEVWPRFLARYAHQP